MRTLTTVGLVTFAMAGGCTSEPGTITGATACSAPAVATVSPDLTPVFTWTPDCTIGYLSVLDTVFQPNWILFDSGSAVPPLNGIRSGVRYGTVPPEAKASGLGTGSPLAAGKVYWLLLRVIDDRGGPGLLVDTVSFIPQLRCLTRAWSATR
jgi:hypothetical protein